MGAEGTRRASGPSGCCSQLPPGMHGGMSASFAYKAPPPGEAGASGVRMARGMVDAALCARSVA